MPWSYYVSLEKARSVFPTLNTEDLACTLVYYDGIILCAFHRLLLIAGQMNDARLNVSLALTAASLGAVIANHVEVTNFIKSTNAAGETKLAGAVVRDRISKEEFPVQAKLVINATGPFSGMFVLGNSC